MKKTPIRLLLIEDDEDDYIWIRDLLSEISSATYELEWVDTYDAALSSLEHGRHDVYLLDYQLGEHNGLEFLHGTMKGPYRTPVIFLTGQGDYGVDVEAMNAGAVDYLDKSRLNTALLERSIRYAMEGAKAEKALKWELRTNAALAEIFKAFLASDAFTIDELSFLLLQHAKRLTGSKLGFAGYIDPATGYLICPTLTRDVWDVCRVTDKDIVFKKPRGLVGWGLDNREHLLTNAPLEDARSSGTPPGHVGIDRFISSPALVGGNELVGQLALANSDEDYTDFDTRAVDLLADLYAAAIQRMRSHDMLQKREHYFRSLLSSMHEDVFVIDRDLRIVDVNRDLLVATGHRREEVVGRYCYEVAHGLSQPCEKHGEVCKVPEVFESGRLTSYRDEHLQANGSRVWVDVHLWPLEDENGATTHVIQTVRDVTAEVELEKRFHRAQRMEAIATLSGGIAHDFNNILGIIMGYTEMVYSEAAEGSSIRDALRQVLQAAMRATDLVRQILTFSSQNEQQKRPMQIGLIVKEVLKMLRASLPSTIEIKSKVRSKATVMADPTHIHQIFMNLCTNAAHAMREHGGLLEVGLSDVHLAAEEIKPYSELHPGPHVLLTVKDTGQGIDPSIMHRIFDPFFTTKELGVGTGLGLAVVHGLVKSHEGEIDVHSFPGRGTTFDILFPATKDSAVAESEENVPLPGGRERILLVDDEPNLVMVVQRMLERLGYQVESRTGSIEALELFRRRLSDKPLDMLITDMNMPHMTGVELARELHRLQPKLPVILCTGFSEQVDARKVKGLNIQGFLSKPVVLRNLAELVRRLLDQRGLSADGAEDGGKEEVGEDHRFGQGTTNQTTAELRRSSPCFSVCPLPVRPENGWNDHRGPKATILVVDDNLIDMKILTTLLKEHDYDVCPATSGALALNTVKLELPDLILLDVKMPEMDGYEVCRRLKADERAREIPVIFISALEETTDKVDAFHAGGVDYITKPFQAEEVLARVAAHICLRSMYKHQEEINEQLCRSREELEQRVEERTVELLAVNERLKAEIIERRRREEESREHQERLVHAARMVSLGTLVSAVASEIDNPAKFIMSNTPVLQRVWKSIAPILDEYCEKQGDFPIGSLSYMELRDTMPALFSGVLEDARRIQSIASELTGFVCQEPREFTEWVDINAVVRTALTLLSNRIKSRTNHLSVEYGKDLPTFRGSSQGIEQVVINLVVNACEALRDKNEGIEISTSHDPASGHIRLEIRDRGIGIGREAPPHIHDSFPSTKRDLGGTGLGLSISSKIIEDHGGAISFETCPGGETSAIVMLPAKNDRIAPSDNDGEAE